MPDDGSVRADALDLEIDGNRLRIVVSDQECRTLLADAFAAHIVDEPAPPALLMRPPDGPGKFHVVVDRSGFVLARTNTARECVAVLGRILAGLLPTPHGAVRLPMRAVASDAGVVIAAFPLFRTSALVERRLQRCGYQIVDGLVTDIDEQLFVVSQEPRWTTTDVPRQVPGHCDRLPTRGITAVLLPQIGSSTPSRAQSIAFLAGGNPQHREQSLDTAARLSELVIPVQVDRSGSPTADLYALLTSLVHPKQDSE